MAMELTRIKLFRPDQSLFYRGPVDREYSSTDLACGGRSALAATGASAQQTAPALQPYPRNLTAIGTSSRKILSLTSPNLATRRQSKCMCLPTETGLSLR